MAMTRKERGNQLVQRLGDAGIVLVEWDGLHLIRLGVPLIDTGVSLSSYNQETGSVSNAAVTILICFSVDPILCLTKTCRLCAMSPPSWI